MSNAQSSIPSFLTLDQLRAYAANCMESMSIHGCTPISVRLCVKLCYCSMVVDCFRDGTVKMVEC